MKCYATRNSFWIYIVHQLSIPEKQEYYDINTYMHKSIYYIYESNCVFYYDNWKWYSYYALILESTGDIIVCLCNTNDLVQVYIFFRIH